MTISAPLRRLLLTVHVVAAGGLVGTDLALVALGVSSVAGADPRTVYPAASLMETFLVAPLAVVAFATGVVLAVGSRWGLLRHWWVTIKLATTAVLTLLVVLVLVPSLAASADAAAAGHAFAAAERLPLAVAPSVAVVALVVNVALAVSKPSWRVRRRTSSTM